MCVCAHSFYATLSEAPSGLDNTSPLLLSVSHSSLFPSPWREGVKKREEVGGGAVEITGCCQEGLREREREGARGEKRRERIMGGGEKVFAVHII